ncbi:hypothetical protein ACFL0U_00765 [Pseudomonadota bacterium]
MEEEELVSLSGVLRARGKQVDGRQVLPTMNGNGHDSSIEWIPAGGYGEAYKKKKSSFYKKVKPGEDIPVIVKVLGPVVSLDAEMVVEVPVKGLYFPYYKVSRRDGSYSYVQAEIMSKGDFSRGGLQIATGCCLFGAGAVYFITSKGRRVYVCDPKYMSTLELESGEVVTSMHVDDTLSLYEVSSVVERVQVMNGLDGEVVHNTPKSAYYLYARQLLDQGRITQKLFAKWVAAVDERSAMVTGMEARVSRNPLVVVDPLKPFKHLILDPRVQLGDIIAKLEYGRRIDSESNQFWQDYFAFVRASEGREITYLDINYGSYLKVYADCVRSGQPLVCVEKSEEFVLVGKFQKFCKSPQGCKYAPKVGFGAVLVLDSVRSMLPTGQIVGKNYYDHPPVSGIEISGMFKGIVSDVLLSRTEDALLQVRSDLAIKRIVKLVEKVRVLLESRSEYEDLLEEVGPLEKAVQVVREERNLEKATSQTERLLPMLGGLVEKIEQRAPESVLPSPVSSELIPLPEEDGVHITRH